MTLPLKRWILGSFRVDWRPRFYEHRLFQALEEDDVVGNRHAERARAVLFHVTGALVRGHMTCGDSVEAVGRPPRWAAVDAFIVSVEIQIGESRLYRTADGPIEIPGCS